MVNVLGADLRLRHSLLRNCQNYVEGCMFKEDNLLYFKECLE